MNKKKTFQLIGLVATFILLTQACPGWADDMQVKVQGFLDGTSGFLVKTVGSGVFSLGLAVAGIKIAGGDQGGLRNAVMVMIGGAVIFLAKPLVGILQSLATSAGR